MNIENIIDNTFSEIEGNLAEQYWEALDILHEAVRSKITELQLNESYYNRIAATALLFIELMEKEEMEADDKEAILALKNAILATFTFEQAA